MLLFFFVFCELKFGVKLIKNKFLWTFIFTNKIASELNIETESLSVFFFCEKWVKRIRQQVNFSVGLKGILFLFLRTQIIRVCVQLKYNYRKSITVKAIIKKVFFKKKT